MKIVPSWQNKLESRLKEYYQVFSEAMGVVLILIQGSDGVVWTIRVKLGENLEFYEAESTSECHDTKLVMQLSILEEILKDPENFEPRRDFYSRNIKIYGNLNLAHYFAQLLKRPGDYALQVLKTVHQHPNNPTRTLQEDGFNFPLMLRCVADNQPIVFRQCVRWPSIHWDLDKFDGELGFLPVRFNAVEEKLETLSDISRKLRKNDSQRIYTAGVRLPKEAVQHFSFPQELESLATPIQVWMGRSRQNHALTKLHCDIYTSLLVQVWGRKKVRLYPPQHHAYLYPMRAFRGYQPCLVNPLKPDFQRYPEFFKARCLEVEISPGDMLVIPSGWFHCLEANGLNFSVSRGIPLEVAYDFISSR